MNTQSRTIPTPGRPAKFFTVDMMVKIAVLAAIARVVMLFEFSLPFFPGFLKLDFSELISLFGAFAMGPLAGVLIVLVKCLIHLLNSTTQGVGDLANFLVGGAFVWTAGMYYQRHKTRTGAIVSLCLGTAAIVIVGAVVNHFVTLPLYALVMGWSIEKIVGMSAGVIPAIHDEFTLILYAFCPFNLLKGIVLSLLALPLYKKLSPFLHMGLLGRKQN